MSIQSVPFLKATLGQGYGLPQGIGQASTNQYQYKPQQQEAPYHQGLGLPSTEDMEKALAYIQSGEGVSNPFEAGKAQAAAHGIEKPGWEGFQLPPNNGTGDLQPNTVTDEQGKNLYCFG